MNRRDLIRSLGFLGSGALRALTLAPGVHASAFSIARPHSLPNAAEIEAGPRPQFPGPAKDYHGFSMHDLMVDGCDGRVVQPDNPLPGRHWIWRTMFWDAFPGADLAFLKAGFYVAYLDVGNTFGCPDAMKHFDVFYNTMVREYGFSKKAVLEGLSRGGLYAYRWAYVNTDKVGCIYGDAPVCDMKSWPGGMGKGKGSPKDWQAAIEAYHFTNADEMKPFKGNPIDILEPIAAAHIPIIHVCGDKDTVVPADENTDIVRSRYMALGGDFALIVKRGCDHHPHGLADPSPVVDFVLAHCARKEAPKEALKRAPRPGSVITLAEGQW